MAVQPEHPNTAARKVKGRRTSHRAEPGDDHIVGRFSVHRERVRFRIDLQQIRASAFRIPYLTGNEGKCTSAEVSDGTQLEVSHR